MQTSRWICGLSLAVALVGGLCAQPPDITLPRPGAIVVSDLTGTLTMVTGDQRKTMKVDERLRVGSTIMTGRRTLATLLFSNGTRLQLGAETDLEIEEFGQSPISSSVKIAELKEEPTLSRTRLRLVRGDVSVVVKPLKVARGSTFHLSTLVGTLRTGEATVRALIQMSDLGLGICNVELQSGAAEFEPLGGNYQRMPVGQKFAFTIEQDKQTGAVKLGEMPKPVPAAKK